MDSIFADVPRSFLSPLLAVRVAVVNGDAEEPSWEIMVKEEVVCCLELVVREATGWEVMLFELVVCPRVAVLPETWN